MSNVYINGEESLKNELLALIGNNNKIQNEPDNQTDIIFDLDNFPLGNKVKNIEYFDEHNSSEIPVITSTLCFAVSEQTTISKFPNRLIGAGFYDTFSKASLLEITISKITSNDILSSAEEFLKSNKIDFAKVPDRPGLVFPRVLSMIINEAAQVYSEDIAERNDIDTAMKLGTNYPFGPLEWADKLGVDLVYNVLLNLQRYFGEDRYRPHFSLKEMTDLKKLGVKTGTGFYSY